MTIFVAAVGDANDPLTWSGTPWHLLSWAAADDRDFKGLTLDRPGEMKRRIWNLWRLLRTGKFGGFQYSPTFLEGLWRGQHARLAGHDVVNCFQLYPRSLLNDRRIRKWFYIDATLRQLFADPYAVELPAEIHDAAIRLETLGYAAADGIICHSRWAADSIVQDYGIDEAKVRVVVPGANLSLDAWRHIQGSLTSDRIDGPLRMVFIGRYWQRKGLDRLLAAMQIASARGVPLALRVIGCEQADLPAELRDVPGVEWCGSIEKDREPERFLDTVRWAEVGCLLSRVEFGGMVQREFAALGLVALGPDVCGAPDHAGPGAVLIKPDATPDEIASELEVLASRGEKYERLRAIARSRQTDALWSTSVRQLESFIRPG